MKIKWFIFLLVILHYKNSCAQNTWRFPISFEDAVGAKDTIWCIWDSSAHGTTPVDTNFGEGAFQFDYSKFNVWMLNPDFDSTKVAAIPYVGSFNIYINAFNFQYPLMVSWDTALFHSPILPWSIGVTDASIENDYFFAVNNDPPNQTFNMIWDNHVSAPAFNWGGQSQFPMTFYINRQTAGINDVINEKSIEVFPNPFISSFKINSEKLILSAFLLNASTSEIITELFRNKYESTVSNLNHLPPGLYIIKFLTDQTTTYYKKIIKLP